MSKIEVLDHGYVSFVECWGSDQRVIEAARMSTGKGFLGWDPGPCPDCGGVGVLRTSAPCATCNASGHLIGDQRLLAYLYRERHATPFEMAGLTITVQAPIFVFREWHRHRTQSYNEMSGRYVPIPNINYSPEITNILNRARYATSTKNKQAKGSGTRVPTQSEVFDWLLSVQDYYREGHRINQKGIEIGLPLEIARIVTPVARYSRMMASAKLRNWLEFLTLRMDNKAQWEIRQYANVVGSLIQANFPRTWELFDHSRAQH